MTTHILKEQPDPFLAVEIGAKTSEFRKYDRNFQVGDDLILMEWNPSIGFCSPKYESIPKWTGRAIRKTISHIQTGFGIPEGYCVLSLRGVHSSFEIPYPQNYYEKFYPAPQEEKASTA